MLQISFTDFQTLLNEVYLRVAEDGVDSPQCVDTPQLWNRIIGGPRFTGDAHTIYSQAGTFYTQIPNTPDGVPQAGDIVVWSPAYNGGPGHVGIATGTGDTNTFEVFEQNDPLGSDAHTKVYDYTDVMGWLRPIQLPQDQQGVMNQLRTDRDKNWGLYQQELQKNAILQQQLSDCQRQVINTQVPVTTNNGTIEIPIGVNPVVSPVTEGISSANSTTTSTNPTTIVQSTNSGSMIKPALPIGQRIVFFFMNIFSTLNKYVRGNAKSN